MIPKRIDKHGDRGGERERDLWTCFSFPKSKFAAGGPPPNPGSLAPREYVKEEEESPTTQKKPINTLINYIKRVIS